MPPRVHLMCSAYHILINKYVMSHKMTSIVIIILMTTPAYYLGWPLYVDELRATTDFITADIQGRFTEIQYMLKYTTFVSLCDGFIICVDFKIADTCSLYKHLVYQKWCNIWEFWHVNWDVCNVMGSMKMRQIFLDIATRDIWVQAGLSASASDLIRRNTNDVRLSWLIHSK